jgi:hypothetical protein
MFFEPDHPLVPENDWLQFSSQLPLYLKAALNRETIELPHWFLPLSRGALIASPFLLRSLARKRRRPSGWTSLTADTYQRAAGKTRLRVRRTRDGRFWTILRWRPGANQRSNKTAETIVHTFGSTPVLAATRYRAQQLAELFDACGPAAGLRWARVSPRWLVGALAFAIQRAEFEGLKISWDYDWSSDARRVRSRSTYTDRQPVPIDVRFALQAARGPTASNILKPMMQ